MNPKVEIINGKVHLILSRKSSKILGEMGDYSNAIAEDVANGLGDSVWFSYSVEDVRKLMKGIHWAMVNLFDEISQTKPKFIKHMKDGEKNEI